MKYEFIKKTLDEYELKYFKGNEEKIIPFKITNEIATELSSIVKNANMKMYADMNKNGLTKNDFIIKKENNGVVTYDETNFNEFQEKYIKLEEALILNDIIEKMFKMNIKDLFEDMGVLALPENEQQVALLKFSTKLGTIIRGEEKKPSEEK